MRAVALAILCLAWEYDSAHQAAAADPAGGVALLLFVASVLCIIFGK